MTTIDWNQLQQLAAYVLTDGTEGWVQFWRALNPVLDGWAHRNDLYSRKKVGCIDPEEVVLLAWERLQQNDYNKIRAYFRRHKNRDETVELASECFHAWLLRVFRNICQEYLRRLSMDKTSEATAPSITDSQQRFPRTLYDTYRHQTLSFDSIAHSQPGMGFAPVSASQDSSLYRQELLSAMLGFLDSSVPQGQLTAVEMSERGERAETIAKALGLSSEISANRVVQRGRERLKYRAAIALWCEGLDDTEIAARLDLHGPEHARRVIRAARRLLRHYFRPDASMC